MSNLSVSESRIPERVDAYVENHGSLFLVYPVSSTACDWLTENVSEDAQYFGSALVCEHRYIVDLIHGMLERGLVVR